jgi:hypothetical protein
MSVIDESRSINDTSRVIRMAFISDVTDMSITYDRHSDDSRGVIYDHNIFIIQATVLKDTTSFWALFNSNLWTFGAITRELHFILFY